MSNSFAKVHQKKLFARKRKRALFTGLYILLALGIVFSGLSFLSHSESISIQKISIQGTTGMSATVVESVALEEISGNFLSFFSKRNVFIYPVDRIEEKIASLSFVGRVEVKRNGLQEIEIILEERKESVQWCEGGVFETAHCFSVDERGFIFDRATTSAPFIYRGLLSENPIGKNIISEENFKEIQFFVRELSRLGLAPLEAVLDESNYATIVLELGGKVVVNTERDLTPALSNLASILSDKKVVVSLDTFLRELDYIKLDSGNKVVYKLK